MISHALPSFWSAYRIIDGDLRIQARKAYRLWKENPYHPSLHFKCVDSEENVWSVRISRGYRALGIRDGNKVIWFWIGPHDEYMRFLS